MIRPLLLVPTTPRRRGGRAVPLAAIALLAALAAAVAPACATHDCELSTDPHVYGTGAFEGDFLDATTWETTPLDATWLNFPGGRTINVRIEKWAAEGRPMVELHGYVSAASVPNAVPPPGQGPDNWTEGTGNLVEFSEVGPGTMAVTNATCSQFYLRVVAHAGAAPDAGAADATNE